MPSPPGPPWLCSPCKHAPCDLAAVQLVPTGKSRVRSCCQPALHSNTASSAFTSRIGRTNGSHVHTSCRASTTNGASSSSSSTTTTSSSSSAACPSAVSDVLSLAGETFDVVVVGAGIGGLSCAAMLAYYGLQVVVLEAHSVAGGAAHCWSWRDCHFDSGTALFFGLPAAAAAPSSHTIEHHSAAVNRGTATAAAIAGSSDNDSSSSSSSRPAAVRSPDNPLAAVLQILGQPLDLIPYGADRTCLVFPEGTFRAQIGSELFPGVVRQLWGDRAEQEWLDLQQLCRHLAQQAAGLHPVVVRYDPCVAVTAGLRRPGRFARFLSSQPDLMGPQVMFSQLVSVVSSPDLRAFLDVLCKGTSGAAASDISAAYMVRAFAEMYQPGTQLQWPRGGPQAIADALVRGLRAHGGKLLLNSPVASVLEGAAGRAGGVVLHGGGGQRQVRARRAVVSNASLWDTQRLVPEGQLLPEFQQQLSALQPSDSFVHLHAVVDWQQAASGPAGGSSGGGSSGGSSSSSSTPAPELPVHTYFLAPELVGDTGWPTLTIGTALDDSLAPPGKQILHAYMAEPHDPWVGLQRGTPAYAALKADKAEVLWGLIEQVVPGARSHLDWQTVGTPLTHTHFRRRHQGCYGVKSAVSTPAAAGAATTNSSSGSSGGGGTGTMQPQAVLAMKGLYCCGDNTFPYVGTPAVAASGMWVANTLAPVWKHWRAADVVDP